MSYNGGLKRRKMLSQLILGTYVAFFIDFSLPFVGASTVRASKSKQRSLK